MCSSDICIFFLHKGFHIRYSCMLLLSLFYCKNDMIWVFILDTIKEFIVDMKEERTMK